MCYVAGVGKYSDSEKQLSHAKRCATLRFYTSIYKISETIYIMYCKLRPKVCR